MQQVALKYFLVSPYASVLRYQENIFEHSIAEKEAGTKPAQTLIICQHHPVYTLGKSGSMDNLLVKPEDVGAVFEQINRGGDVTFHGPGQLVSYPILDLEQLGMGVREYVRKLEEVLIKTIAPYGIEGQLDENAAGIWLDVGKPTQRKIAAIGIKVSKYVTMHGIALNVNTDLSFFKHIVPCGLENKDTTSLQRELGKALNMIEVVNHFKASFEEVFNCKIV